LVNLLSKTPPTVKTFGVAAALCGMFVLSPGCILTPAEEHDFSRLPDNPLTLPIRKWVRSWETVHPTAQIAHDLSMDFLGRPVSHFEQAVSENGGSCRAGGFEAQTICEAAFSWITRSRGSVKGKEICLRYDIRTTKNLVSAIGVQVTCFK
jgi:hypothetical protein